MKVLKFLIGISAVLFFITRAWASFGLSNNASLLLNGNLKGAMLVSTQHAFLTAHIHIMYSSVFAVITAILLAFYAISLLGKKDNRQ